MLLVKYICKFVVLSLRLTLCQSLKGYSKLSYKLFNIHTLVSMSHICYPVEYLTLKINAYTILIREICHRTILVNVQGS